MGKRLQSLNQSVQKSVSRERIRTRNGRERSKSPTVLHGEGGVLQEDGKPREVAPDQKVRVCGGMRVKSKAPCGKLPQTLTTLRRA